MLAMVKNNLTFPKINAERVWQRHMELARIGATDAGGVHRLALDERDIEAHCLIDSWARQRGFATELDSIGNMFICRAGTSVQKTPVGSGSHIDTQPYGGRFDGALGVLTAFEALETYEDHGIETPCCVEVAIWNNEEGARFLPGLSGSGAYTGVFALDEMLACTDADGVTMRSCVERLSQALPHAGRRDLGRAYAGFVEAHIEQATLLEEAGDTIGIVTDIQGNRRFEVTVDGEAAHSGTTPRSRRKDAFIAATDIATALRKFFADNDPEDIARFTIGIFDVQPGAKSIVPGRVEFFIDFRHPSADTLKVLGDEIAVIAKGNEGQCSATVREVSSAAPDAFSAEVVSMVTAAAERHGYAGQRIVSGAGHDARYLLRMCPTGMVFIPCKDGISHNEKESAEPGDVAAAAQVVSDVLLELAYR